MVLKDDDGVEPPPPPSLLPADLLRFLPEDSLCLSTLPLASRCALAQHLFGSQEVNCLRSPFCLKYRLTRDGCSLSTMYHSQHDYHSGPVILLLRSLKGQDIESSPIIVGLFLSEPLVPRNDSLVRPTGDGTTFAFTWSQESEFILYPTGALDAAGPSSFSSLCFALCTENSCSFGMSEEHGTCLLRVDSDLEWVSGGASDTFRNSGCVFPGVGKSSDASEERLRLGEVELLCKVLCS